jgi:hypothetical protein
VPSVPSGCLQAIPREGEAITMALVLYIIAFVLLLLAAFGVGYSRISFGWLGLAIWLFTYALLPHIG